MHRFLIESDAVNDNRCLLSEEESKHALRVLRLETGDEIELCDGKGSLFSARIADIEGGRVLCAIEDTLDNREAPIKLTLYMGLSKFEKMEFVAQKATELGVSRVVPVIMQRSVVKLDDKDIVKKRERMEKIAKEAAKQCGRAVVPDIDPATPVKALVPRFREHELFMIPWEEASGRRIRDVYGEKGTAKDIALLIGPEGGITPEEVALSGACPVTLGPRILRAETAAVTSVSLVMQLWGDI